MKHTKNNIEGKRNINIPWTNLHVWQLFPENPGEHVHVQETTWVVQVPPFTQGDSRQGSTTERKKEKNLLRENMFKPYGCISQQAILY